MNTSFSRENSENHVSQQDQGRIPPLLNHFDSSIFALILVIRGALIIFLEREGSVLEENYLKQH